MKKFIFVSALLIAISLVAFGSTFILFKKQNSGADAKDDELVVVTSFYPMYIAALNICDGAEGVVVENLSQPTTGCLHDYQLTTEDMKLLSTADVFIVNGGGIESFLAEVAEEYPNLIVIDACDGIELTDDNAHVWMSVEKHMQQVQNIADELAEADAANTARYADNCSEYILQLEELQLQIEELKSTLSGTNVILFQESFAYLAEDLDLNVVATIDLDEERQVSAGEVADVLAAIENEGVGLIISDETYGVDLAETVAAQSGVQVLYLDNLVSGEYAMESYVSGMRGNLSNLKEYLNNSQ